jgi:MFS transporter, DHA3 family, macrolide efflux protein
MTDPTAKPIAPLSVPNFRKLWLGQTISQIGDGLTNLAVLIVVSQLTGSTAALAGITIAIALPQLLFGLVAGVFVDRWDRKKIMIVSDVLRGLLVLGLIVVRDPSQVWIFYVLSFLQAAIGTFFDPARGAVMAQVLERESLLAGNALSQTTRVIAGVAGMGLAGVLVGLAHNGWPAFVVDSLTFFVSAIFVAAIALPRQAPRTNAPVNVRNLTNEMSDGLRFILGKRHLFGVLMTFAVTMLGIGSVNVLFVPYLTQQLNARTEVLGLLEAAQVAGMIAGSTLVATLAARIKIQWIVAVGVAGMGAMVGAMGFATEWWMIMIAMLILGLCLTPVQAAASTIMQQQVPDDKRGRAGSAMNTVITLASVISMAVAGVLGDVIGIRQVFFIAGGITIVAAIMAAVLLNDSVLAPTVESAPNTAV